MEERMFEGICFSIITVCYNSANTISDTIESMLNQTFKNYEYILVDGGSTDGTLDIINSYKDKFSRKLMVVSEPDDGIYDAMNKGVKISKGKIIGIINSDDWYEPTTLEKVWRIYSESDNEKIIIYGSIRYIKEEKEESIHFFNHEFLEDRMISHPSTFVSKNVYKNLGNFDCSYKIVADYDFVLRAKEAGILFCGIKDVLSNFRLGGKSNSRETDGELIELYYRHNIYSKEEYKIKKIQYKHAQLKLRIKYYLNEFFG